MGVEQIDTTRRPACIYGLKLIARCLGVLYDSIMILSLILSTRGHFLMQRVSVTVVGKISDSNPVCPVLYR